MSADRLPDNAGKRVTEYIGALQLTIHTLKMKLKFRRDVWGSTAPSKVRSQEHNGKARCAHKNTNPQYNGRIQRAVPSTEEGRNSVIIPLLFKLTWCQEV